jgi:ABC-type phosphate transport system auxiliary subunit
MSTSLQQQVTDLYDRLAALNSQFIKLCLNSRIITIEDDLRDSLDTTISSLETAQEQIKTIQNDLADIIVELRSL